MALRETYSSRVPLSIERPSGLEATWSREWLGEVRLSGIADLSIATRKAEGSTNNRRGTAYPDASTGSLRNQLDRMSLDSVTNPPRSSRMEVAVQRPGDDASGPTNRASGLGNTWKTGPTIKQPVRGPLDDEKPSDLPHGTKKRFEGYESSRDPVRDYQLGRVVEVLVVPPPAGTTDVLGLSSSTYTRIEGTRVQRRRFVVIRPASSEQQGFQVLPIKTYNGHGVEGQTKWHHCIIYTSRPRPHPNPPSPTKRELPQRLPNGQLEDPMQTQAIRVEPNDRGWALDPMSRLDFFDVHDFGRDMDHVRLFGKVHRNSRAVLRYQYEAVWAAISGRVGNVIEPSLPIAETQDWYNQLRQRAVQLGLSRPPELTKEEVQRFASSHDARTQFSVRLQRSWAREMQQRRAGAQRARGYDRDDKEDDESDEDDGSDEND